MKPSTWLDAPTSRAVPGHALDLARTALAAWVRLANPDPDRERNGARVGGREADLHDARVALRRLRSHLRTWKRAMGGAAGRRLRERLREVQRESGAERDREVLCRWIDGLDAAALEAASRDTLRSHLEGGPLAGSPRAVEWAERVRQVVQRMERDLAEIRVSVRVDGSSVEGPWCEDLARRARRLVRSLADALARAREHPTPGELHRARIRGKHLRYALEPAAGALDGAAELVRASKDLQDVLGEVQDAHVAARRLQSPDLVDALPASELARLAEHNRARQERALGTIAASFDATFDARLADLAERFARACGERARAGHEIERKYLLSRLPALPPGAEVLEIEQGWLPGERIAERLRRTRSGARLRHERALKLGAGLRRIEVEEDVDEALFARLWPLTEGCRVRKRRHRVRAGAHLWEIDEFLDFPLVLAEVELAHVDERAPLPVWLEACVVREVTEEVAFTNLALARGRGR